MSWIIVIGLGLAVILLVFSLLKKLVKLAFTALTLVLLIGGIWYFWQEGNMEIPEPVLQAGEEAAGKLGEVAGDALDRAAEAAKEGAGRAMDKAAEVARERAEQTIDEMAGRSPSAGTDPADDQDASQPAAPEDPVQKDRAEKDSGDP